MTDITGALGSRPSAGTVQITVFIPSVDRDRQPIDQVSWREGALRVLGTLFRGATAFPPGRGVWRDDDRGGILLFEEIVLVTSYAEPEDVHDDNLRRLRGFLHELGRQANQGEVGVVLDGDYYGITTYDGD